MFRVCLGGVKGAVDQTQVLCLLSTHCHRATLMLAKLGRQDNKVSQLRKVAEQSRQSRMLKELTSQVGSTWSQVLH